MASTSVNKRKQLQFLIDVLFLSSPGDMSTVEIAAKANMHPGVVGAVLTRAAWATRRRRVRINRNKVETRWAISDAALVDYARRNAHCLLRKAAILAAKGIEVRVDRDRVTLKCGSVTTIVHAD